MDRGTEIKCNFYLGTQQDEDNLESLDISEKDLIDLENSNSDQDEGLIVQEDTQTKPKSRNPSNGQMYSNLTEKQNKQNQMKVQNYKKQPIIQKYQPIEEQSQEYSSSGSTCQCIAQVFCFSSFLIVIGVCIFDLKLVESYFNMFITWVRSHPFLAIGAINLLYTSTLVMTLPISLNHIMLGFTYSQVFHSKTRGLFFTIPVSMSGVLTGSLISFVLSRYLFKQMVTQQIEQSPWVFRNFKAIDSLLASEGVTVVALLRLTFAPFGVSNYILGVTSISLSQYMLGTCSYVLNCALQVFIGCSFYSIQNPTLKPEEKPQNADQKKLQNTILIIEIVFTLLVTTVMGLYAKRLVQRKMDELNAQSEAESEEDIMKTNAKAGLEPSQNEAEASANNSSQNSGSKMQAARPVNGKARADLEQAKQKKL